MEGEPLLPKGEGEDCQSMILNCSPKLHEHFLSENVRPKINTSWNNGVWGLFSPTGVVGRGQLAASRF